MVKPRIELMSGFLSGITGVAGVAYSVFGKTYIQQIDHGPQTRVRLLDVQELEPVTIVALVVIAILPVIVAIGAYLHVVRSLPAGRVLALGATALFLVAFWLTGLSMGPFLLPSVVLAVVTSILAAAGGAMHKGPPGARLP